MYLPRTLEAFLPTVAEQFGAVLLTGARQVGKSTLLRQLATPERTFVTLDDQLLRALARSDPALFLQRFAAPLVIDEIQYAPELLPYIKMAVDRDVRPGQYWLTGSQQFQLMKGVAESLAGRVGIVQLLGLSQHERRGAGASATPFLPEPDLLLARHRGCDPVGLTALFEQIWRGSYPALVAQPSWDRDLFFSSYVQTYLQRDVRDLARVGDEMAFLRFLRATAARTAQLLNVADLARDADVAPNTAKHWLSILETSGVIVLLPAWHSNATKRLVKAPKLHMLDTGLASWLTAWSSPQTLAVGAASGQMLETWVVAEIIKSYWHNGNSPQFYHVRDKDGVEIDFLMVQDGVGHPIEVKKSANPSAGDARHFRVLRESGLKSGSGAVVCLCTEPLPLAQGAWSVPVGLI